MKFTLSWLQTFVSLEGLTSAQLGDRLTMLGLEVESIRDLAQGLDGIIVVRLTQVEKHPNADRLTVCTVDTGSGEVTVICGAPNARVGLVTALAPVGVTLPGGMRISKAKIRGVTSQGMLCSGRELGLDDDHSGIMELATDLQPGTPLVEALHLDDTVIEVDLTPNRPDCASVLGIAREVAGFTHQPLRLPVTDPGPLDGQGIDARVTIDTPALCPRYAARRLSGVTIGPSPAWMQRRLLAVGLRPINNIVDITNYVMLEYGQPLHAFDFEQLAQARIVVRQPTAGETTLVTLDNVQRRIEPDMLLICDGDRPVAVAGIMGGLDTEVTGSTREILLEAACFDPVSIRRTARRLNLPSEASYRFERGVDPELAPVALERAVQLMIELAGASPRGHTLDVYPGKKDPLVLELRVAKVNQLLGTELSDEAITSYLQGIGFAVNPGDATRLQVTVPTFRPDVEREVDLVEEIARLYGYNEVPVTMPTIGMDCPSRDRLLQRRRQLARFFTAHGFCEAINYSFVSPRHLEQLGLARDDRRLQTTRLLNPLTEEQSILRTSLLPGLLENIRRNINFQQTDIRLFEIGKIFIQEQEGEQPAEYYRLAAVLSGGRYPGARPLYFKDQEVDFFDVKGVAEHCLQELGVRGSRGACRLQQDDRSCQPYADPAMFMRIMDGDREVGRFGRLAPAVGRAFALKQDVFFLELDVEMLASLPEQVVAFHPLPRYPAVRRDIALLVAEDIEAGALLAAIDAQKEKLVESVEIFDVYQGEPIADGMKSVALSITYRSAQQTLADESVDTVHEKIVNSLMSQFGGRYREGVD